MKVSRMIPAVDRYWMKVVKDPSGCWLWTGNLNGYRYAAFVVDGKSVFAHRWAFEQFVAPIPEGKQIDHMCGVTRCVNPWHLRPLEAYENVRAYWREQRGTCRNGHDMTDPANIKWKGTTRKCRTCLRANQSRYREKQRH